MVPTHAAPRVLDRPHAISFQLEVPEAGADGVLFSMGGNDGGFSFSVQNGLLTYGYNYVAEQLFHVRSGGPIPSGHPIVTAEFTPTGPAAIAKGKGTPAKVVLDVDGEPVGEGSLLVTIPLSLGLAAGVAVGADPGFAGPARLPAPLRLRGAHQAGPRGCERNAGGGPQGAVTDDFGAAVAVDTE